MNVKNIQKYEKDRIGTLHLIRGKEANLPPKHKYPLPESMFFLINWQEPECSQRSTFVLVTIKSKFDLVTFLKPLSPLDMVSTNSL
jgi:hypothetical protein